MLRPEVEMVGNSHRSRRAPALSNREELRERARSRDRWLVGPDVGADLVGASIRGYDTKACSRARAARVVTPVVLDDVVLSLRGVDPAIHSKVGTRARGAVGGRVGDRSDKG